jgi:hypothetical protein
MSTKRRTPSTDELRPEYNLSELRGGVRGKYYDRATAGTNLVLIEPDLAAAFPDAQAVNDALRVLVKVATTQVRSSVIKTPPPNGVAFWRWRSASERSEPRGDQR